jgi:chromosome partitioning protein
MYVLVLASQKGGSGKTTLSGHLAIEAEQAGVGPVALIDCDPQGSLSDWWNSRVSPTPHFVKVGLLELSEALAQLKQAGFRLAVIDTPPAITSSISRVVAHADLVIVPTRPSPHDLRAVAATVDIAERHEKPLIFVVNGATPRARITGEAAVALSQHGTVAPVIVHHRVDFAASMVDGRSVGEVVPKSQSSKEVRELWTYVQDRLARLAKDPTLTPEFRPRHLDLGPLAAIEDADLAATSASEAPPFVEPLRESAAAIQGVQPPMERGWDGVDRRLASERRATQAPLFGTPDKRVHVFGRRHTDRPAEH